MKRGFDKFVIFSLALLFGLGSAAAQDRLVDSIMQLPADTTRSAGAILDGMSSTYKPHYSPRHSLFQPDLSVNSSLYEPLRIAPITPGAANLHTWDNGAITAYGSSMSYPALLGRESGRMNFRQNFGNLVLNLNATVDKYGYYRSLARSYGFGGSLSYRFSEKLSLTLFGSYSQNTGIGQAAMFDMVSVPSFGGYLDIKLSDTFGFMVGAQSHHSLSSGHWEARPMLTPYVNLGGIGPIGVDVGGILYEVLREKTYRHANPTLGPPVGGPPPIRPRE